MSTLTRSEAIASLMLLLAQFFERPSFDYDPGPREVPQKSNKHEHRIVMNHQQHDPNSLRMLEGISRLSPSCLWPQFFLPPTSASSHLFC